MGTTKRITKQNHRPRSEREKREVRFDAIMARVSEDHGTTQASKLRRAYNWAEDDFQQHLALNKQYAFADPLRVLEYIGEQSKDCDVLIAAALFPKFCPTAEKAFDGPELVKIRNPLSFGPKVYNFLLHAIKLEAFRLLALKSGASQTAPEQLSLFRYAALNIAEKKEVVLIRGAYRYIQLLELDEHANFKSPNRQTIDQEIQEIRDVIAPVAYRAGYERLRYDLLDICFKIEEPVRYERIKEQRAGDVTPADLAEAHAIISKTFQEMLPEKFELYEREAKDLFELKVGPKSVYSSDQKSKAKGVPVDQLNDCNRFRIIFDETIGMYPGFDYQSLDLKRRREHIARMGKIVVELYTSFSDLHGRNSKDPQIMEQFALLDLLDPDKTLYGDDNYIDNPKPVGIEGGELGEFDFGYSAINAIFFIRLSSGKLLRLEGQLGEKLRHKNNQDHPQVAPVNYKTNMLPEGIDGVFIYDANNQLLKLPEGSTDLDYAKLCYTNKDIPFITPNLQVILDNDDPTARRTARPSRPGTPLISGDRVRFIIG